MKIYLIFILLIAFILRVYDLHYSTPFIDEAQYIVVGLRILGGDLISGIAASSWVGGFPYVFPLLTAAFYSLGGIIGSRMFTVILGTICVFLMYQLTQQLMFFKDKRMNQKAGLFAATFLAVTTIGITTSRLAIYDGLAFTLFFLGIILFHRAVYSGEKFIYVISAIILFLSFLAKYIVIIFFPFLLLVPIVLAIKLKQRWQDCVKGVVVHFCIPLLVLTGLYIGLNFSNLKEFFVNQGVVERTSESEVIRLFWQYTGIPFTLSLLSLSLLWKNDKFLSIVLLLFSFIPLVVHSIVGNTVSVQQHTFLSLIFALPIVGAGLAALLQKQKKLGSMFIIVALGFQVFITVGQVQEAESFWPNVTEATTEIRSNIEPSDRVLAESGDSVYLELQYNIPYEQLSGPFTFTYAGEEGLPAYIAAIENGYFHFVQLDGTYFPQEDRQAIERALQDKYRETYDNGSIKVYELDNG